jgi:hypothetical protein
MAFEPQGGRAVLKAAFPSDHIDAVMAAEETVPDRPLNPGQLWAAALPWGTRLVAQMLADTDRLRRLYGRHGARSRRGRPRATWGRVQ